MFSTLLSTLLSLILKTGTEKKWSESAVCWGYVPKSVESKIYSNPTALAGSWETGFVPLQSGGLCLTTQLGIPGKRTLIAMCNCKFWKRPAQGKRPLLQSLQSPKLSSVQAQVLLGVADIFGFLGLVESHPDSSLLDNANVACCGPDNGEPVVFPAQPLSLCPQPWFTGLCQVGPRMRVYTLKPIGFLLLVAGYSWIMFFQVQHSSAQCRGNFVPKIQIIQRLR